MEGTSLRHTEIEAHVAQAHGMSTSSGGRQQQPAAPQPIDEEPLPLSLHLGSRENAYWRQYRIRTLMTIDKTWCAYVADFHLLDRGRPLTLSSHCLLHLNTFLVRR